MVTEKIKDFININADLIEDNKWEEVYSNLTTGMAYILADVGRFTIVMFDAGINPFLYGDAIESYSFYKTDIEEFKVPNNVTIIKECAFCHCLNLKDIILPPYLKKIRNHAFYDCRSLEKISIPSTLEVIGGQAFAGCQSLKDIYYDGTKEQWRVIKKLSMWNTDTMVDIIHCSDGDIEL